MAVWGVPPLLATVPKDLVVLALPFFLTDGKLLGLKNDIETTAIGTVILYISPFEDKDVPVRSYASIG